MSTEQNYTPISTASRVTTADQVTIEIQKLEKMLHDAPIPHELWERVNMQLQRINLGLAHGGNMAQIDVLSRYVEWITSLPWSTSSEDILDLTHAKEIMDAHHFGLDDIKKRVMEYISVLALQKNMQGGGEGKSPVLFFVGLAGTGKTTIAQSIAEALGRKSVRIPFGGLASVLDLRGQARIQPESEPGMIIKSLRRVGTNNPVILLDELDRVEDSVRGAVMGVLLELLDPHQNSAFVDHYIDFPFDLSKALFIATANNTKTISTAVLDRLEIIQMPSYTDEQKIHIAKNYILPRLLKDTGIAPEGVLVTDGVWATIARASGFDPGIRSVERKVESMVRSVALKTIQGGAQNFEIHESNMNQFVQQ